MGKVKNIIFWLLILVYLLIVPGMVADHSSEIPCDKLEISIIDSNHHNFINRQDILEILRKGDIKVLGKRLKDIDTKKIEQVLSKKTLVKNAEVYKAIDGTVHVDVNQREPVIRLMDRNYRGYYIDREGKIMSLSSKYTPHILVANGHFVVNEDLQDIFDTGKHVDKKNNKTLQDLYKIANFIEQDNFWKAQLLQIYVTREGEFELIPRVGAHVIKFGNITGYQDKFKKLAALYSGGFNKEGWNNHDIINLKYRNQVVCTKR